MPTSFEAPTAVIGARCVNHVRGLNAPSSAQSVPGVPLADRADDLGLEAFGDLEQLDQLIRPGRTRPGAAVLGVEVFDCEADLLDRVITEHVFDSTQGVRQLRVTDHLVVDGRDQPVGEQAATPHLVVMTDRERGVGQGAGEQLADREAAKRDEDRVREI